MARDTQGPGKSRIITRDSKGRITSDTGGGRSTIEVKGGGKGKTNPVVENPATGAGVRYETNVPGLTGYAGAGVTVTYGPSGNSRQAVSGTSGRYSGTTRTYTTPTGQRVTITQTPTSPGTLANREAELRRAAEQGKRLTLQQEAELRTALQREAVRRDGVTIALDKEAVNKQNEQFRQAGISNAGDFMREAKAGRLEVRNNQILIKGQQENKVYDFEKQTNEEAIYFYAPKTTNPGETLSNLNQKQFNPYIESKNTLRFKPKTRLEKAEQKSKELYFTNVEQPRYSTPFGTFTYTAGSAFYGFSLFGWSVVRAFPNPVEKGIFRETYDFGKALATDPVKTTAEVGREAISNPAKFAGSLAGYKVFGDVASKVSPVKIEIVKDMNVPKGGDVFVQGKQLGYASSRETRNIYTVNPAEIKRGMVSGLKITYPGGSKTINRPAYQTFLNNNPLYADLLNTEVQIDTQPTYTYRTVISKENGRTVAKDIKEQVPNPGREIEIGGGAGFEEFNELYKYDEQLKAFVPRKQPGTFKDRFSDEPAEDILSQDVTKAAGGGGSSTEKSPFKKLSSLSGRQKVDYVLVEEEASINKVNIKPFQNDQLTPVNLRIYAAGAAPKTSPLQRQFSSNAAGQGSALSGKTEYSLIPKNISYQVQMPKTGVFGASKSTQRSLSSVTQVQNVSVVQAQVQAQAQAQAAIQSLRTVSKLKTTTIRPLLLGKKKESSPKAAFKGFDVLIKKRGQFLRANSQAFSKADAINFGASMVDKTSAASFRLVPSKLQTAGVFKGKAKLNRFSSRPGGLFIEKNKFRINSPGEFLAITDRGQASQRFNKLFRGQRKRRKKTR